MAHSGYDKQRFPSLMDDSFDCIICSEIVMDPLQCDQCGRLFCKVCISDWLSKSPATKCPNRCKSNITPVRSKALIKLYGSLMIKCSNEKCDKVVRLDEVVKHEEICKQVKCWNFANCEKPQNTAITSKQPMCSQTCHILYKICKNFGNHKIMYEALNEFQTQTGLKVGGGSNGGRLCWDNTRFGTGIILSDNNQQAFLKQEAYVFRSVVGNIGFSSGINYWEILADSRTENQLKIGITGNKDFDMNSAFCDHPFGYAYYGLGQLRNGSNATGPTYGKRFKKTGILGVCLNMNKGTLSFSLDGEPMGVAYQDVRLKSGTYYPAVSLLHTAGCKIRGGVSVPHYFL